MIHQSPRVRHYSAGHLVINILPGKQDAEREFVFPLPLLRHTRTTRSNGLCDVAPALSPFYDMAKAAHDVNPHSHTWTPHPGLYKQGDRHPLVRERERERERGVSSFTKESHLLHKLPRGHSPFRNRLYLLESPWLCAHSPSDDQQHTRPADSLAMRIARWRETKAFRNKERELGPFEQGPFK